MKKILVFAGSNSSDSINQKLAVYADGLLKNAEAAIIKLTDYPAPLYSKDLEAIDGIPQTMVDLHQMFSEHGGFIISLPEHNSSVTPIFKNMVDWISRHERPVFKNKPILLMSTSPGKRGGITNLEYISQIMPWWGGKVIAEFSLPNFFDNMDTESLQLNNNEEKVKLDEAIITFEDAVSNAG